MKINKKQLDILTSEIIEKVIFDDKIMYERISDDNHTVFFGDREADLVDIVCSLHNIIYELITGERYDYMFHWANKMGCCVDDDVFDNILKGDNNENK